MNIGKGKSRFLSAMLFAGFALTMSNAFAALDQAAIDKCKACHQETAANFATGAHHGRAFIKGDTKYGCEACHGPGDKHIAAGGGKESIIVFGKKSTQSLEEQSKQCLSCHQKAPALAMWNQGKHKSNDVACASCHSTHKQKDAQNPETCFSCHKDVKRDVGKLSHHPIVEGKVSCSSCHNPHGSLTHGMIKTDNVNQLCYKCHADKRGPFVWEHAAVEENCSNCHKPHGSNHYALLTRRVPALCQECHGSGHGMYTLDNNLAMGRPPAFPADSTNNRISKFVKSRSCTDCHGRIHGSNGPGAAALMR